MLRLLPLAAVLLAAAGCATAPPPDPGYPTLDRVRYVQECMRDHPGPTFEMTNKCVCAIDRLAEQLPHEQFVQMSTALNANTIGGERGAYIRDVASLQADIKRFRELNTAAKQGCFIGVGPR